MSVSKVLGLVAWNVAAIAVCLVIVEIGLRFTKFDQARNPAAGNPPEYYVADNELGVRIRPNQPAGFFTFRGPGHPVFSNSMGCFDRAVKLAPGEPYILAIGDSFTWGYTPLEKKWTSLIEERSRTRVLKCGVPGTGTKYQLGFLKRLLSELPHPPAQVIHLYDTTDFNDDFIFPGETVTGNQRMDSFTRIRLSDGKVFQRSPGLHSRRRGQMYGSNGAKRTSPFVLAALADIALTTDSRVEKRRLVIEGQEPEFLHWRYEFNLLLLEPETYPHVAQKHEQHLATLREFRDVVRQSGADYLLFHTNSFRLPEDKPLVAGLKAFLDRMPEFRGWLPELGRHLFDPHWNAESEKRVADIILPHVRGFGKSLDHRRISRRNDVNEPM